MVDRWVDFGVSGMMEPRAVVSASDYDALAARLAEAEALLQEVYDCRQSLMSIGLVYRIGHTLNHRPADSAASHKSGQSSPMPPDSASACTCDGEYKYDADCPVHGDPSFATDQPNDASTP